MDGVADLRVILIVIASLIFLLLFMSLVYVLYRRIRFRQRSQSSVDPEARGVHPYDGHDLPPSKELLHFFCWEYGNGPVYSVEPSYRIREGVGVHLQVQPQAPVQGLYGCELKWPRTIIVESVKPKQEEFCDCDEVVVPPEEAEVVAEVKDDPVMEEEDEDAIPFSTASPSPFFYTPSSSPGRDEESALGNISTGSRVLQSS